MAFTITPETPQEDSFVQFGGNIGFYWDFGDGSTSQLLTPSHIYADPGFYDVVFTIYDSELNILHQESQQIEIAVVVGLPWMPIAKLGIESLGRAGV